MAAHRCNLGMFNRVPTGSTLVPDHRLRGSPRLFRGCLGPRYALRRHTMEAPLMTYLNALKILFTLPVAFL